MLLDLVVKCHLNISSHLYSLWCTLVFLYCICFYPDCPTYSLLSWQPAEKRSSLSYWSKTHLFQTLRQVFSSEHLQIWKANFFYSLHKLCSVQFHFSASGLKNLSRCRKHCGGLLTCCSLQKPVQWLKREGNRCHRKSNRWADEPGRNIPTSKLLSSLGLLAAVSYVYWTTGALIEFMHVPHF